MSVHSSKCAHFTSPRQNHKAGFMPLWCLPTLLSGSQSHSLPARFMPPELTPATCPKHFLTTLRLYFQQNADQHDLLIRIHGSPCDSSQLKDLPRETGPERVKLSRGKAAFRRVPLPPWAWPPGSAACSRLCFCAWKSGLTPLPSLLSLWAENQSMPYFPTSTPLSQCWNPRSLV